MLMFALAAQFVLFLGTLFFSARRTIRPKGFFDGIIVGALVLYGLLVGLCFLFSVVIPSVLIALGVDRHVVINSFPEEIGIPPVVLLGWFPALIFAVVVRAIGDIAKMIVKKVKTNPNMDAGEMR
jgi:hypothetical protein